MDLGTAIVFFHLLQSTVAGFILTLHDESIRNE